MPCVMSRAPYADPEKAARKLVEITIAQLAAGPAETKQSIGRWIALDDQNPFILVIYSSTTLLLVALALAITLT